MLGLAVVLLLPRWVPSPDESTPATSPIAEHPPAPPPVDPQPAPSEPASQGTERAAADRRLQAYLRSAARLELARAPIWGEPEWSRATRGAAAADHQYGQGEFREAAAGYRQAEQQLQALETQREPRLAASLAAGRQALEQDDAPTAKAQFALALAIEPQHADATRGLARAEARPALLALLQTAHKAELEGDLKAALIAYRDAARMDPAYPPASAGRDRVAAALAEVVFRQLMSGALSDLQSGHLERAGEALQRAEQLKPQDPAVADTRELLARERQQARLARLRRDAENRARAEDWSAAANLYQQALQTEPNAGFARQGLELARERRELHRQLERYLDDPARLQSPEPRANAEHLLATLNPGPEQPKLSEKLAKLEQQVAQARTPIPVTLHSDGHTEVVIYHVGRLGRFQQRSLELQPGRYTAVGSRDGYRDVRRQFQVQADRPPAPVLVRCEDPL
jgi:hypothetical protein